MAVVFPGQGSQRPGMAKDFFDRFACARDAFAEASDALGLDVAALCFEEDPRLDRTEFTQPAILTAEVAMTRALAELGLAPAWFGGHSLGEYTALCAAGVLPLGEAARLVRRRGALMQEAAPEGAGAMLAVIAQGIAEGDLAAMLAGLDVDVANKNSPEQVVLSGPTAAIDAAAARLEERFAGTEHEVVRLNVSAPFHSRMMRPMEPALRAALEAAPLEAERARRVTSNFTGGFHDGTRAGLVDALVRQASGDVDWVANMRALAKVATSIYEVGPNRPLAKFFRSIGVEVTPILNVRAAEKALAGGAK